MDVTFRPRKPEDNPVLAKMAVQTMGKVVQESAGYALSEPMALRQIEENQVTTIIEHKHQPIGYYSYSMLPTGQMYLSAVIIVPEFQHHGIGRLVAERIEREARSHQTDTILGHIHYANQQSLIFWLKNGWKIIGPHMHGTLAVQKKLDPALPSDSHSTPTKAPPKKRKSNLTRSKRYVK